MNIHNYLCMKLLYWPQFAIRELFVRNCVGIPSTIWSLKFQIFVSKYLFLIELQHLMTYIKLVGPWIASKSARWKIKSLSSFCHDNLYPGFNLLFRFGVSFSWRCVGQGWLFAQAAAVNLQSNMNILWKISHHFVIHHYCCARRCFWFSWPGAPMRRLITGIRKAQPARTRSPLH